MSKVDSFEKKYIKEPMSGCWLWKAALDAKGYGRFLSDKKIVKAHRWAYEHYVGEIPKGLIVCHKCDVRSCVNPSHLFVGTDLDNSNDKVSKKRHLFGESHPQVKLTEEQVLFIKNSSLSYRILAKMLNVGKTAIERIKTNNSWKHLNG